VPNSVGREIVIARQARVAVFGFRLLWSAFDGRRLKKTPHSLSLAFPGGTYDAF